MNRKRMRYEGGKILAEEKRFAVLIDSDNVSVKYIKYILDEVSNYGITTYKRIYGDWTSSNANSWKKVFKIKPEELSI